MPSSTYSVYIIYDLSNSMSGCVRSISAMKASPFYGAFATDLDRWEKALALISEVLDTQLTAQRQWMYLESIFMASEDIR